MQFFLITADAKMGFDDGIAINPCIITDDGGFQYNSPNGGLPNHVTGKNERFAFWLKFNACAEAFGRSCTFNSTDDTNGGYMENNGSIKGLVRGYRWSLA